MTSLDRWVIFAVSGARPRRAPRRRRSGRGPVRDARYMAWIRTLPCCACGLGPSQAAHTGHDGGMAQKASDRSCVPLCPECHSEYDHGRAGKAEFERSRGVRMAAVWAELNAQYDGLAKVA